MNNRKHFDRLYRILGVAYTIRLLAWFEIFILFVTLNLAVLAFETRSTPFFLFSLIIFIGLALFYIQFSFMITEEFKKYLAIKINGEK